MTRAVFAVLAVAGLLAGCGDDEPISSSSPTPAPTAAATETPTPTPTPTETATPTATEQPAPEEQEGGAGDEEEARWLDRAARVVEERLAGLGNDYLGALVDRFEQRWRERPQPANPGVLP
jgi:hypothetical protein